MKLNSAALADKANNMILDEAAKVAVVAQAESLLGLGLKCPQQDLVNRLFAVGHVAFVRTAKKRITDERTFVSVVTYLIEQANHVADEQAIDALLTLSDAPEEEVVSDYIQGYLSRIKRKSSDELTEKLAEFYQLVQGKTSEIIGENEVVPTLEDAAQVMAAEIVVESVKAATSFAQVCRKHKKKLSARQYSRVACEYVYFAVHITDHFVMNVTSGKKREAFMSSLAQDIQEILDETVARHDPMFLANTFSFDALNDRTTEYGKCYDLFDRKPTTHDEATFSENTILFELARLVSGIAGNDKFIGAAIETAIELMRSLMLHEKVEMLVGDEAEDEQSEQQQVIMTSLCQRIISASLKAAASFSKAEETTGITLTPEKFTQVAIEYAYLLTYLTEEVACERVDDFAAFAESLEGSLTAIFAAAKAPADEPHFGKYRNHLTVDQKVELNPELDGLPLPVDETGLVPAYTAEEFEMRSEEYSEFNTKPFLLDEEDETEEELGDDFGEVISEVIDSDYDLSDAALDIAKLAWKEVDAEGLLTF